MGYLVSWKTTVTTAGTAVRLTAGAPVSEIEAGTIAVQYVATNTGNVAVGNDNGNSGAGDVTMTTGFVLSDATAPLIMKPPDGKVHEAWVDAANDGDGVIVMILEGAVSVT